MSSCSGSHTRYAALVTSTALETPRDRRRLRTRRELSAAAVRLFEERGFAATTVEDIAAAADYSASTFFRMFTRKEDAVFFDMPDRLDALRAELDVLEPSPRWPAIRAALLDHARTWENEDLEFAAARVRLFHREPALASRYLEYCQQYENWLAELVPRAPEDLAATRGQAGESGQHQCGLADARVTRDSCRATAAPWLVLS